MRLPIIFPLWSDWLLYLEIDVIDFANLFLFFAQFLHQCVHSHLNPDSNEGPCWPGKPTKWLSPTSCCWHSTSGSSPPHLLSWIHTVASSCWWAFSGRVTTRCNLRSSQGRYVQRCLCMRRAVQFAPLQALFCIDISTWRLSHHIHPVMCNTWGYFYSG